MNEIKETTLPPGTSGAPSQAHQPDRVQQVDPSRQYAYYRFLYGDTVLAELIAVNEGSDRYAFIPDQEYWRFNGDRTSIDTYEYKNLDVTKEARDWDREPPFNSSDQTDFICSLRPVWSSVDPYLPAIACHHYDEPFGPCGFRLSVSRPDTRSEWVGTITWVRPMERFAPLFLNRTDYQLTKVSLDQGSTVTNLVGTYWTGPITNYGDGDWKDPVVSASFATGLQVIYGGNNYGIINLRMAYPDQQFSGWASDDMNGTKDPADGDANLGAPVNQVSVRTGFYMNYSLGPVNLDCGGGWVTPYKPDKNTQDIAAFIPERCAVVGIQGKQRAGYGLVDLKIAYREMP